MSIRIKKEAVFALKKQPKFLMVGDSHPECAYNDSLISGLKNISKSGESYFYNYFKVKQVIKDNPNVSTIFIEYNNTQVKTEMDNWIWKKSKYLDRGYSKYAPFMDIDDHLLLLKNNPGGFYNALSISMKKNTTKIIKKDYDYSKIIGGYYYLEREKADSLIKKRKGYKVQTTSKYSETNLLYLDKIIALCKKNNIRVVLIRSPLHPLSGSYRNEITYSKLLETRYKNITYLDFSNFPLHNADFGDLEHLNYKGARKFSLWFSKLLSEGLLERKHPNIYVEKQLSNL